MAQQEILQKRPVSLAEVKDVLKKVHKRDEELSFRGGKTQDYVNDAASLTFKQVKECIKKLEALDIPRLKEEHYIKLVDTLPETAEQVKVVLSGYNVTVTKDNLSALIGVLDEFR